MEKLSREDFRARFGELHASIFTGRSIGDGCFRVEDWNKVLLAASLQDLPRRERQAWITALRSVGEYELIATETETDERHDVSVVARAVEDIFLEILTDDLLGLFAFVEVFGPSGRWGIAFEEDYVCLGGEPAFMRVFVESAGGLALLRERFQRYAESEWSGSLAYLDTILRGVGWDRPASPGS